MNTARLPKAFSTAGAVPSVRRVLLACGVASSLVYFVGTNILGPLRWAGYDSISQSVSELSAIDAPSRPFMIPTFVLYSPDDLNLRSSMRLFAAAAPDEPAFREVLDRYFGGSPDPRTITLLGARGS